MYLYQTTTNSDGMMAYVVANTGPKGGFNVILRDMDAEASVGGYVEVQDMDKARGMADAFVKEPA